MFRPLAFLFCSLSLASAAASTRGIGCFVPGRCENGEVVGGKDRIETPEACLELCQGTGNCLFWSHQASNKFCIAYSTCPELTEAICSDCVSGDSTCGECFQPGRCLGSLVAVDTAVDVDACQQNCVLNAECAFFTFETTNSLCTLTKDCDDVDGCDTCTHGPKSCDDVPTTTQPPSSTSTSTPMDSTSSSTPTSTASTESSSTSTATLPPPTDPLDLIMVVGGYNSQFLDDVEYVDMSTDNPTTCNKPADFTFPLADAVGFFFQNQPWVCGGATQAATNEECHSFNYQINQWSERPGLASGREYAASNPIKSGSELWITGGIDNGIYLQSTEILGSDGQSRPGPDLPEPLAEHCMVSMDNNNIMIAGGQTDQATTSKKAWSYNFATDIWTPLPDLLSERYGHTCMTMDYGNNGLEVVVAGGWMMRSSDIYSVQYNVWRNGPVFDEDVYKATSLAYQDTFIVIGGFNTFAVTRGIRKFEGSNYTWKTLPQQLSLARNHHASMFVPSNYASCSKE